MARKRMTEEPDDSDRWLISYADLMTSMFAFFVVLYAVSSVQEMKFKQMSSSLGSALGNELPPTPDKVVSESNRPLLFVATPLHSVLLAPKPIAVLIPPPLAVSTLLDETPKLDDEAIHNQLKILQEKMQMQTIASELEQQLAPLIDQGKIRIKLSSWGISLEMNASILFSAAEAKLNPNSFEILESIAEVLKDQALTIHVAGYTDNKAISNPYYPSNWELSSARAGSVVRLLIDAGIESKRLAAIGYADNQPVASNASAEGRMRNRRVQLSIMAKSAAELESLSKNGIPSH
jgi:chemotaxis protein MotB